MSMFTPGPWYVQRYDGENYRITCQREDCVSHIARLDEWCLCDEHKGSTLANAMLIVHAPEMVEALRAIELLTRGTLSTHAHTIAQGILERMERAEDSWL